MFPTLKRKLAFVVATCLLLIPLNSVTRPLTVKAQSNPNVVEPENSGQPVWQQIKTSNDIALQSADYAIATRVALGDTSIGLFKHKALSFTATSTDAGLLLAQVTMGWQSIALLGAIISLVTFVVASCYLLTRWLSGKRIYGEEDEK